MGHNVQSQAGVSLSEVYDVKGTQAPIERLEVSEVAGVHELGATIQSERFSGTVRRFQTGALGQSVDFDNSISDLPAGVSRIVGLVVLVDTAARTDFVMVSVRDPGSGREVPIFVWESSIDPTKDIRISDQGAATVNTKCLWLDSNATVLSMLVGSDQPQVMEDIQFRGHTSAFGAGTVKYTLLVYIAFAAIGGISSRGLPVPSW